MNDDYSVKPDIEEHHVIYGTAQRALSEKWGLKVYLCAHHHRIGQDAAHNNPQISKMLKDKAQRAFEREWPDLDFRSIFGKNYKLEQYDIKETQRSEGHYGFIELNGGDAYENDCRGNC